MSKQLKNLIKLEIWIPIGITIIANIIILTAYFESMKSDIRDLGTILNIYNKKVDNMMTALNEVEAATSGLKAIHNMK